MTKKDELLKLILESIKPLSFKSVDLLERFTYEKEDLPVCILKEDSTQINIASSMCWEHTCELNICIIDMNAHYDLAQEILEAIKQIPQDTYIFTIKSTTLESRFEEVPFYQITLIFEVKYYSQDYTL